MKKRKTQPKGRNERRAHYLEEWKALGKTIREKRDELGFTQAEMAKRCKLTTAYYGHLEQGYDDPRKAKLSVKKALASALHMGYEELWGD